MTHAVTETGIHCKYIDYGVPCSVDCFHEGLNFLIIDLDEYIGCTLCRLSSGSHISRCGYSGWTGGIPENQYSTGGTLVGDHPRKNGPTRGGTVGAGRTRTSSSGEEPMENLPRFMHGLLRRSSKPHHWGLGLSFVAAYIEHAYITH